MFCFTLANPLLRATMKMVNLLVACQRESVSTSLVRQQRLREMWAEFVALYGEDYPAWGLTIQEIKD
jgi:hypothetical protein